MQKLLAATDNETYRCLLELLLTSGLRIGEALGLTIADLDTTHSLIRVEYQLGRDGTRTPLKTAESQRTIDIPPRLMQRLLALVSKQGDLLDPAGFVLESRNGSGLERKTARAALQRATKTANLPAPGPTLHDLRHTHASMLIGLDIPLVGVQRRLGHRKPDTTLRIYTHQWKDREARRSHIGQTLGHLFNPPAALDLPTPPVVRLALPPPTPNPDRLG